MQNAENLLTTTEAAFMLNASYSAVVKITEKHGLPCYRLGKKRMFRIDDIRKLYLSMWNTAGTEFADRQFKRNYETLKNSKNKEQNK